VLLASIVGSGMAFLDGTVVTVALPALGRSLQTDLAGLQWTINAYLLTLSAFLLTGGGLGDRLGRKNVFSVGVVGFALASVLCGLAGNVHLLIWARALQGVAAALLVPVSLSLMRADLAAEDQGEALGLWTGMSGVTGAVGPLVGGWLVDSFSWRSIFFLNVPFAAVALWAAWRFLPAESAKRSPVPIDVPGAVAAALAVGGVTYALIEGPPRGWPAVTLAAAAVGALSGVAFLLLERRPNAMVPLSFFRAPAFAGANLATLFLYAALSCALFLLVLELQVSLGMSPLAAGAVLLPATVLMATLSPVAGRWAQRHGSRWPMTVGAAISALSFVLFSLVSPDRGWVGALPGVALLGLGLAIGVAPLTKAVLGALEPEEAGVASGVNNAIARVAGLLGVAAIPWAAGMAGMNGVLSPERVASAFHRAMWICAALCLMAAIVAAVLVRDSGEQEGGPAVTAEK